MIRIRRALPPVLLAAAALAFAVAVERSLACPVYVPPQPLRTLYKASERVVVARVGAKEVLSVKDALASVRIALHVTENVKGPPAEVLHLHQTELLMSEAEEAEKEKEEKEEEKAKAVSLSHGPGVQRLKRGERYLFFLDPREQGEGYEVDDENYGIKELSDAALKVYLERLKELAEITRREPEDKVAVVEWLVRCAEHPATRWEGAYELVGSAEAAGGGDEEAAEASTTEPEAEAEGPAAEEENDSPDEAAAADAQAAPDSAAEESRRLRPGSLDDETRHTSPDPELAPLLNAVQKQRLADAFFAAPDPVAGDDELMQLVKDFGDPRFPGFLLARLRRFEGQAPLEAELWLRTLVDSLKNEQLVELADAYTQEAPYMEEEEVPEAETRTDAPAAEGGATEQEGVEAEEVEATPVDPEVEAARLVAATERATRTRSAMLKSLLSRVELFISTGQLASN